MSAGVIAASYVASAPATTYYDIVMADGPIAYWRMDETSGLSLLDSSGNSRTATLTGTPGYASTGLIAGDPNKSMTFSGDDSASRGDSALYPDVFTVEGLLNLDLNTGGGIANCDQFANHKSWSLSISTGGKLVAQCYNSSGTGFTITGTTTLAVGTTYHVALVRSLTGFKIYLNGTLEASSTTVTTFQGSPGFFIGTWRGVTPNRITGRLDEIAIYAQALTSAKLFQRVVAAGIIAAPGNTGGKSVYLPDHSEFVLWPAGTNVGDLIVIQTEYGWTGLPPSGWAVHYNLSTTNGSGALFSKVMDSSDIAADGVLLTATGNFDFPGACNVARIAGSSSREILTNTGGGTLITIGASPSNVEQIVANCDLDLTAPTSVAVIDFNFWWSMSEGGGGKVVTWRIRKDDLSGTVLASGSQGASVDSTAGHDRNPNGQVVDPTPTTGRYVLTVQCTGGFTSPIYSNSRFFRVSGGVPAVRTFSGSYAGSGFTSEALVSPAALAAGEVVLWMAGTRADSSLGLNRATLVDSAHGANASSGLWRETTTGSGTLSGTFSSTVSGANKILQAVMVSLP